jgi:hypothetical protein
MMIYANELTVVTDYLMRSHAGRCKHRPQTARRIVAVRVHVRVVAPFDHQTRVVLDCTLYTTQIDFIPQFLQRSCVYSRQASHYYAIRDSDDICER